MLPTIQEPVKRAVKTGVEAGKELALRLRPVLSHRVTWALAAVVVLAFGLSKCFTGVEPGQGAVRINRLTGGMTMLPQGWSVAVPGLSRIVRYPLREQIFRSERGAKAAGAAPFQSLEGLSVGAEITVRYTLDPGRIREIALRLPENVARELIDPVIDASIYRVLAQHNVREIFSSQRREIEQAIEKELKDHLAGDGVVIRAVFLGNVDLPQEYRNGMERLLAEELSAEKMRYTLELKDKQVKQAELEGEAEKVKRDKEAEAAGNQEVIAAKARAEAMQHILPFKEREIEQRRLEAEAARVTRLKTAEAEADARRIETNGEADSRRKLAEADAYRVEVMGKASSEQLAREGVVVSQNPLLIQKTLADKLSDKIQVIIAPPQAGFVAAGLLGVQANTPVKLEATARRTASKPSESESTETSDAEGR